MRFHKPYNRVETKLSSYTLNRMNKAQVRGTHARFSTQSAVVVKCVSQSGGVLSTILALASCRCAWFRYALRPFLAWSCDSVVYGRGAATAAKTCLSVIPTVCCSRPLPPQVYQSPLCTHGVAREVLPRPRPPLHSPFAEPTETYA